MPLTVIITVTIVTHTTVCSPAQEVRSEVKTGSILKFAKKLKKQEMTDIVVFLKLAQCELREQLHHQDSSVQHFNVEHSSCLILALIR